MAQKTTISWTDHTFNIAWGCTKVSPGCKNCYADALSHRYGHDVWGPGKPRRIFGEKHWREPLQWNSQAQSQGVRHRVFCSSMCDVFEDHPTIDGEREKLWSLIRATPWLDWQLLTKRPGRIRPALPADWGGGYGNVWLGTSIESNDYTARADILRTIPATVRFISYEPALGPLDQLNLTGIDWLIYGGESGDASGPMTSSGPRTFTIAVKRLGRHFSTSNRQDVSPAGKRPSTVKSSKTIHSDESRCSFSRNRTRPPLKRGISCLIGSFVAVQRQSFGCGFSAIPLSH
jgi:protein gp37